MPAQTVLEELSRDELTADYVQQRVADWVKRIEALYADVERWLPVGWTARRGTSVPMHEELMRKVGVPSRGLPTLELIHGGVVSATLRPYGLWIIGTNGRIDLVKGQERYLLLDHAGTFEPADWRTAPSTARRDSKPFNGAWLKALLVALSRYRRFKSYTKRSTAASTLSLALPRPEEFRVKFSGLSKSY